MKITYIADKNHKELKDLLQCTTTEKAMPVDFEGDLSSSGTMSLMQLSFGIGTKAYILDVLKCPELLRGTKLANAFENPSLVKVFHDCRNDAIALKGQFGITMQNVFDTQAAHFELSDRHSIHRQVGMNFVLAEYAGKENTQKHNVVHRHGLWEQRPLPSYLLNYAAQDVVYLLAVYREMQRRIAVHAGAQELFEAIKARSNQMATPRKSANQMATPPKSANQMAVQIQNELKKKKKKKNPSTSTGDKDGIRKVVKQLEGNRTMLEAPPKSANQMAVQIQNELKKKKKKKNPSTSTGDKNGIRKLVKQLEGNRTMLEANKGGLLVSEINQGDVIPVGGRTTQQITVQNMGTATRWLSSVKLLRTDGLTFQLTVPSPLPARLDPAASFAVHLQCAPTCAGLHCNTLVFSFVSFSIARFLEVRCGDAALLDDLKPSAPFRKSRKKQLALPAQTVVGAPTSRPNAADVTWRPVPKYAIPQRFGQQLQLGKIEDALEQSFAALRSSERNVALKAYSGHWSKLLWAEERQLAQDLASFNLVGESATVLSKRGASTLELHVAGLAEKRPSVVVGDKVRVRQCGQQRKAWEGVATYIHREEVGLAFHSSFHQLHQLGMRVDVEFVLPRMPLRLCHQGVDLARQLPPDVLFPALPLTPRPPRVSTFSPFNRNVGANSAQQAAVLSMLQGTCRPVPYVLFGPPGTGKTTTLVEAIMQSLHCAGMPATLKVLVCAPTNAAADVICERMAAMQEPHLSRSEMMRLMAYSRSENTVPANVLPFTNKDADGAFTMPPLADLQRPRVVVTSLSMASKLFNAGMERGHFDIIFIDEAGQAIEPEAVAPVASLLASDGQLVLAGDVKQLGPVIHSGVAKKMGLQTSFMERLMSRAPYSKDLALHPDTLGYDSRVLTKLQLNFRSHPALLELPNALFYDNELESKGDPATVNNCLPWDGLQEPGIPMIFEGVEGKDSREANSPSWFNADEAVVVLRYVEELLRAQLPVKVQPSDIGVITPYNKQVHKIQRLLRQECLGDVKVGSTEMFQGSEKRIIIISTVRSSRDFVASDKLHQLGFLDNPKRFNVSITRPSSLLIVVGNPRVLAGDRCWGALLRQCLRQNVYRGVQPPELDDEADDQQQSELGLALAELFRQDESDEVSEMMAQEAAAMPDHEL